jgi:hypothetical protein
VIRPARAIDRAGPDLEDITQLRRQLGHDLAARRKAVGSGNCTTLRIYYNQAPAPGDAYGLANFSACCGGMSGLANPSNVHDTYADYTWYYPYGQSGTDLVVLIDQANPGNCLIKVE